VPKVSRVVAECWVRHRRDFITHIELIVLDSLRGNMAGVPLGLRDVSAKEAHHVPCPVASRPEEERVAREEGDELSFLDVPRCEEAIAVNIARTDAAAIDAQPKLFDSCHHHIPTHLPIFDPACLPIVLSNIDKHLTYVRHCKWCPSLHRTGCLGTEADC
jgi:hypothetical protein